MDASPSKKHFHFLSHKAASLFYSERRSHAIFPPVHIFQIDFHYFFVSFRSLQPVNLPGLASTRGVKLQKYRKFDDVGLILCSSTRLEDVPCADSFSVEDTLVVSVVFK